MDLLPKTSSEFSKEKYWDEFFTKRKEDPFEWYGEYNELSNLLHKYVSQKDSLLVVGCGNSTLSVDLFSAGITNQINIDISSVVINQMQSQYPSMTFIQDDVTSLSFADGRFSCVLDKGTFDALSPPPNKKNENEPKEKVATDLMLEEISRVIKVTGRFVCISLLQPHVAKRLLTFFYQLGWMIRVCRCYAAEECNEKKSADGTVFPVFMMIFTKMTLSHNLKPLLEVSQLPLSNTMTRYENLDALLSYVKEQQYLALLKKGLKNIGFCAENGITMSLSAGGNSGEERYTVHVVDVLKLARNPIEKRFGVFVVPQGRETEWMFGTHEGRAQLALETGFSRLVVVHLVRGQTYESNNKVQEEIGCSMTYFAPKGIVEKNIRAPIMTMGDEIGERKILQRGHSEYSGDFVVEDVTFNQKTARRLIFLNNPNVIQSEVGIKSVKKRGKEFGVPVINNLSCQHHKVMILSFGLVKHIFKISEEDKQMSCMLIGLGGGLLASFLNNFMPNLNLTTVEIDAEIVKVATNYFGFPEANERLKVVVDDGLKFIQSTESKYNIVLIDVDNKSVTEGLSCPPPQFLEAATLEKVKEKMNPQASVFVLNLVCRNEVLKTEYLAHLAKHFPQIYTFKVPDEVNTILFCFNQSLPFTSKTFPHVLKLSIEYVHSIFRGNSNPSANSAANKSSKKKKKGKTENSDDFDDLLDDVEQVMKEFKLLKV